MDNLQLKALLETIGSPARVCDGAGAVVAENTRAAEGRPDWTGIERQNLGGGLSLMCAPEASAPTTCSGCHAGKNDELGELANGMAHSIRNPLSSIVTAASLITDDPAVGEETTMLLGIITKESHHLNRILTEFLSYVKPRHSETTIFDLTEALRKTIGTLQKERTITSVTEIRDSLTPGLWVRADESRIRMALWQVLANAFEAMPDGGILVVEGYQHGKTVHIAVKDTGLGCSDTELPRIFEPFFSSKPEFTGLGLPLARSAFEEAGGSIRGERNQLVSNEGRGMQLSIQLPAANR